MFMQLEAKLYTSITNVFIQVCFNDDIYLNFSNFFFYSYPAVLTTWMLGCAVCFSLSRSIDSIVGYDDMFCVSKTALASNHYVPCGITCRFL